MNTIVPSPKRLLQEQLNTIMKRGPSITARTWLGWDHFRIGTVVREKGGRHEGRIVAVFDSTTARVLWIGSGWKSDVSLAELEIVS
jgi:hypothetical protein